MSKQTCGSCRFRGEAIPVCNEETDWEEVPSDYFLCERIKHCKPYDDAAPTDIAFVKDGSGYYAALCVSDDFGCNRWEAKP